MIFVREKKVFFSRQHELGLTFHPGAEAQYEGHVEAAHHGLEQAQASQSLLVQREGNLGDHTNL